MSDSYFPTSSSHAYNRLCSLKAPYLLVIVLQGLEYAYDIHISSPSRAFPKVLLDDIFTCSRFTFRLYQ